MLVGTRRVTADIRGSAQSCEVDQGQVCLTTVGTWLFKQTATNWSSFWFGEAVSGIAAGAELLSFESFHDEAPTARAFLRISVKAALSTDSLLYSTHLGQSCSR